MAIETTNTAPGAGGYAHEPHAGVQHRIYWRDTEPVLPGPPLAEEIHCDVCVVGGGYTGLWTALFLKQAEPSMRIHVLEADYAGAGASGHNDGFVTPTIGHSLWGLIHRFGAERAKLAYTLVGRSMLELDRFCRRYGIDAELERNGYYQVATNRGQLRRLEHDLELMDRLGSRTQIELLGADQAQERIGAGVIRGAFKVGGALINPHRLARGLARVVREHGVHVHEQTPAATLSTKDGKHVVDTPRGRVVADRLILATNAYQHRFAPFRRKLLPVWSYAAVTEPLTDAQLARIHWPAREGFVEARNFIVFGRLTKQNRILIGGGPAPYHYGRDMDEHRHLRNDNATAVLRQALHNYFPALTDVRFSHAYGGAIAMTRDFVPHVGQLSNGVHYAYGYCGNGIAPTLTAGKALRDLVLERNTPYSNLLFVRRKEAKLPPEPLSFLGARALTALLTLQDRYPGLVRGQFI